jgi:hypothetical protein
VTETETSETQPDATEQQPSRRRTKKQEVTA